jgi:hypothetical protein
MARGRILDYLGWEEVRSQLKAQDLDPVREEMLTASLEASKRSIPEAIRQAYSIVVTVSEKNEIQAFKVTIGSDPLFKTIKDNPLSRIQDTAVSAEALLPGGPYDLWREGETSRRLKDLEGAFAQFPQLPKMLNRKAIHDTLVDGCIEGILVLRLVRPDRTFRTFWRQRPDDIALKGPALEVVLPENAVLSDLSSSLLVPDVLPGLWDESAITVKGVLDYFKGGHVVKVQKEGYEEPLTIPQVDRSVVFAAISEAVRDGKLWLVSGPASIWAEEIPAGLLTEDAVLLAPPPVISSVEILPDSLPEAWQGRCHNRSCDLSRAFQESRTEPSMAQGARSDRRRNPGQIIWRLPSTLATGRVNTLGRSMCDCEFQKTYHLLHHHLRPHRRLVFWLPKPNCARMKSRTWLK